MLRFWDGELPKTSTRKVKRKLVVDELRRLEKLAASGEKARAARRTAAPPTGCSALVAEVIGKPADARSGRTRGSRRTWASTR